MEPQEGERLQALERTIATLIQAYDTLSDELDQTRLRLLAFEAVLGEKGVVSHEELEAKAKAIDEAARVEIEFAPEHEGFRRLRRILQESEEQPDEGNAPR